MTPIDIRRIREARRLAAARRRPSVLWPVGRPELAALVGLGMSDRIIGDYYGVRPEQVVRLRARHGVARLTH
jgi:hypothetical protein